MEKKRILVVTSDVTFVEGGHITIARNTVRALRQQGYDADLVLTPQNRFGRQLRAYAATRFTDVGLDGLHRPVHQVISLRFPSYAVKHPVHVCWLNHRMREYYDLWPVLRAQLRGKAVLKETVRRAIIRAIDRRLLKRNVTKLYAQSGTIQARLRRWGNIPSEVLYPPPPQRDYRTESYQNFFLSVSRLQSLKRIDLFIEALGRTRSRDLKGIIIGDGPERERLQTLVRERGLETRVHLLGGTDEDDSPLALRPLLGRLFRAAQRGLRLRHGRGVRLAQARSHDRGQRRAGGARPGRRVRIHPSARSGAHRRGVRPARGDQRAGREDGQERPRFRLRPDLAGNHPEARDRLRLRPPAPFPALFSYR